MRGRPRRTPCPPHPRRTPPLSALRSRYFRGAPALRPPAGHRLELPRAAPTRAAYVEHPPPGALLPGPSSLGGTQGSRRCAHTGPREWSLLPPSFLLSTQRVYLSIFKTTAAHKKTYSASVYLLLRDLPGLAEKYPFLSLDYFHPYFPDSPHTCGQRTDPAPGLGPCGSHPGGPQPSACHTGETSPRASPMAVHTYLGCYCSSS